ncbi:MAG: hypothetical protein FD155_99 [Bacteroidetes bacterium]|nr:MAG: hypothetical protein FD155_99 [Bacteroidota bacterium]
MSKLFKFGEDVEGYDIPVLNEREVRAAAGMLFVMMFLSILTVIYKQDFTMLKFAVVIFLVDIAIRVFLSPRYAPTLILGRLIVSNQTPEYVGAQQKKFAWIIGLVLAVTMFVLQVVVNSFSPITGLICFICLIFLFFESAFGICLGCKFYSMVYKEKAQYCPGEVCDVKSKQAIQKTNVTQLLIVVGFVVFIVVLVILFKDVMKVPPFDLFGLESAPQP